METATLEDAKNEKTVTGRTEEENTREKGECRYCEEKDFVSNLMSPCNCTGRLKYIHKSCFDKWYNANGCCISCEICKKVYPDYYPLPEISHSDDEDNAEISEEPEPWTSPGTNSTQIQCPMVGRAINSLISSMNEDFNWRRPTFGMILGMIVRIALLLLVGGLVIFIVIKSVPPKEETFIRFLYFALATFTVSVYIMSCVHRCQEDGHELREGEIEMERKRSV